MTMKLDIIAILSINKVHNKVMISSITLEKLMMKIHLKKIGIT